MGLLDLSPGSHTLRVTAGELSSIMPGGLLMGNDPTTATLFLSQDSGHISGGNTMVVHADASVLLPGARVILRGPGGNEIRTEKTEEGSVIRDLKDNVIDLQTFRFVMPAVLDAGLYNIFLETGGCELFAGTYSFTLKGGRGIDLPNYPPMKIGGAVSSGDRLFVGVMNGSSPNSNNRFLMRYGLEIYDVSIWDRPIRLSQVRLSRPVTGVEAEGDVVYLANGEDGLVLVGIHDVGAPHVLGKFPVPGNKATDVALNRRTGVLALSVAGGLGGGYIRFFNTFDPELDQPVG